jgi:hypothetical protein
VRLLLTILAEVVIDLVTGKLEKRERNRAQLQRDLRGDSRQWGAFTRAKRPDATPKAPPSSRR